MVELFEKRSLTFNLFGGYETKEFFLLNSC